VIYTFGNCEIDTERYELRRDRALHPVEPQVFEVLAYLVTNRARVVTKAELLDNIWGDRFVSESALTSRIKAVRRAVGDDGQRQEIVRTVHGRGYRFVATAEETSAIPETVDTGAGVHDAAHLAAMKAHVRAGNRVAALREYDRIDRSTRHALGQGPSEEAIALRDELLAASPAHGVTGALLGREPECERVDRILAEVTDGEGRTLLVSGPPGVGKSSLLRWLQGRTATEGWRTGSGVAAAIEGAWPYAPVLEALADLCRRHPELLDSLDATYRAEIDRALSGRDLDWAREASQQRLFVSAAELLRLAAADSATVLIIDDVHEADEATLRLVHYLARGIMGQRALLVLAHRASPVPAGLEEVRHSLVSRGAAETLSLGPLDAAATRALLAAQGPDPSPDLVDQVWSLSGGLPFYILALARRPAGGASSRDPARQIVRALAAPIRELLQRVAVAGTSFDADELVALSGRGEAEAFAQLDVALESGLVEHGEAGYRFRHPLLRDALIDELAPIDARRFHRDAAHRLAELQSSPARVGHHLLEAGQRDAAVPYVLRAAETDAAMGAYRDALALVESVVGHARGSDGARLLELRADLLVAIGDPRAVPAYREALGAASEEDDRRQLRARLARATVMAGDVETAAATLEGLALDGGPADAAILLARGSVAYFTGDLDGAWEATEAARRLVHRGHTTWQTLDLMALQGLIAHNRGQWFERLRTELQLTRGDTELATAVFDSHLCVAEYLLYGPTPYPEVIELARGLRAKAERAGALRAEAFAGALIGEAALLAGNLELAEKELRDAADLHHEIAATAGEAHSLQRLAQVQVARGDLDEANRLLRRALPQARWSLIALHLMQRIYGTMIEAAGDPAQARTVVDTAIATLGEEDRCMFCDVMFEVPAAIACADVGDVDEALRHLEAAERSASLWEGTAWQAATLEARGHVAQAKGDARGAHRLLADAARLFSESGQPLDSSRCQAAGGAAATLRT
jgi:DNA-binding winged helix-turn-helix (wHTH) protein/predicted negative regulator of RcsB-dependent stress response